MPQISVVVPVYKVEDYLPRCVDSILKQTFIDFELILVDDGSPDNCPFLCDEYARKDSRVHVIHQNNGGLSSARNAGIDWTFANSDSEWIYFVDSDDWIHPKSLEVLLNGANSTGLDVVIGGFEYTEGEEAFVNEDELTAIIWDVEKFFCGDYNVNAVVAWGKLYRRKNFQEIRYPIGKIHEDEFTTYKILFQYEKVAVIQQPLYFYYQNPKGIMGTKWHSQWMDIIEAFDERVEFFKSRNHEMYIFTMWLTLVNLGAKLHALKESSPEIRKKYYKKAYAAWAQRLWRYRKSVSIDSTLIPEDVSLPNSIVLYWKIHKLGSRIKNYFMKY